MSSLATSSSAATNVVFVGDRFVEPHDATVSILDQGYLLGDGVFATMRAYGGTCFRAREHLEEITRGARLLEIPLDPAALERVRSNLDEAAARTRAKDAYVRVTLTRGEVGAASPTLSILARPMLDVPTPADYERGVDAVTVTPRRIPPVCLDGTLKTTSYIVQVLARREVAARGAFEGIQLAVDGSLAGGAMSTLFLIAGRDLYTPSAESGCRLGVTRATVLSLAASVGLTVHERRLEPSMLADADEAFFASTRVECLPIARVDGRALRGRFEMTHALHAALRRRIDEETKPR